ncbi:MAG: 50S ribosomal protein L3 [Chloroflexaceae bacterium]|nr:50S ribosomal protein L3 [Chloroflexaceae bacterium]
MIQGLLGRKVGMTQVFNAVGEAIPVTVIRTGPCVVTQIRTIERDGYESVQLGFEEVPARKITRPQQGHLIDLIKGQSLDQDAERPPKAGMLLRHLREFRADNITDHQVGDVVTVELFQPGQFIDVSGISKGRGFAGVVKRHHFRGGPRTHGQSDRLRAPGSIGGGTAPGRVWKGTRMAGRMGGKRKTIQSLEVVETIPERHLLLVRGAVPGPAEGLLEIRFAAKITRTTAQQ